MAIGFNNSFTQGEVCEDAWDRTDIQPVNKGCRRAHNYMVTVAGPLAKRRGFWDVGSVPEAGVARLIPFYLGMTDALMLLLQDFTAYVYMANGAPMSNGAGGQVNFPIPWSQAQLAGLRYKQVADVIYFRHASGLAPYTIQRNSNTSWTVNAETFPNGPWRPENTDKTFQVAVFGANEMDANTAVTSTGSILTGQVVTMQANRAFFDPGMVGSLVRVRAGDGTASVYAWSPGKNVVGGWYVLSNGRVYVCSVAGSHPDFATNPPVQLSGDQSDGDNLFTYRHDGAGIVQITAVHDATHVDGVVLSTVPVFNGQWTSFFAEGAYSDYRGWPRAWPTVREERLVNAATKDNLDFIDLSETAGFGPKTESYAPGTGVGLVLATDAVRRRLGDGGGGEILWTHATSVLLAGATSGEHIVAGPVLDEPISPQGVVVKQISEFGSEDVYPAKVDKALMFVTTGGQTLRQLMVDPQQNASSEDMTVLASHIGVKKFVQLAWVKQPDETLWCRLGDGELAAFTYHQEQQVKGWSSVGITGGYVVEDIVALPGPGRFMTLWAIVGRNKAGVDQRRVWQLSQVSDQLFMDGAAYVAGAPRQVVTGLGVFEGETVLVLADGAQVSGMVVQGGQITLPAPASVIYVGLPFAAQFTSMTLDLGAIQSELGLRQRPTAAIVSMLTAEAYVGVGDAGPQERVGRRVRADVPGVNAKRLKAQVTLGSDTTRDPVITISDSTAYDSRIYSIRPVVAVGAASG